MTTSEEWAEKLAHYVPEPEPFRFSDTAEARITEISKSLDDLQAESACMQAEVRRLRTLLKLAREHIVQFPGNPVIIAIDCALERRP